MSVTCSGQNYRGDVVARTNSDIKGVIYSLDLRDKDKPWVEEISFPLNYRNNDWGGWIKEPLGNYYWGPNLEG